MARQEYSKEWERAQRERKLLAQKTVRVKFEHLNPAVQTIIKGPSAVEDILKNPTRNFSIKTERGYRAIFELATAFSTFRAVESVLSKKYLLSAAYGAAAVTSATARTLVARLVQKFHSKLADEMKTYGILQTRFEGEYPRDWLNPTIVAQTHPIFSVTRNGDVIFRRATPKEMALLKAQGKFIGKAGLNVWRWRGTLKPPEAIEREKSKAMEKLRDLARRLAPQRRPEPALGYAFRALQPKRQRRR